MAILLTNSVAASGLDVTIEMLKHNHSSLDAIESGIRLVESDPEAGWVGYGGHPNLLGVVELDAGIMDGSNPVSYTHLDVYKRQVLYYEKINF